MTEQAVAELTRRWILIWNVGDPRTLPLAADFEHVSPFGRICGRERYFDQVIVQSKATVTDLVVDEVIVAGDRSAVRYRYTALVPGHPEVEACDWLHLRNGEITKVWAYLDPPF